MPALPFGEILKQVRRKMRRQKKSASSQTSCTDYVQLPLPDGVPNRPDILLCLWKSGYTILVEPYPEEVQDQFHAYVGGYLVNQDRDEGLSDLELYLLR